MALKPALLLAKSAVIGCLLISLYFHNHPVNQSINHLVTQNPIQINQIIKIQGESIMSSLQTIGIVSQVNLLASFSEKKTSKQNKGINLTSLQKAAQTLEDKAEEVLSRDRLVNTARRARMADSVESEARKQLALAKTIFRLIEGIKAGETKYLSNIRTKVQVEFLQYTLNYAKNVRSSKLRLPEWEAKSRPVDQADAEFATYPYPCIDSYEAKILFALSDKIPNLDKPLLKLKDITCYVPSTSIVFNTTEKLELLEWIVKELKASNKYEASRLVDYIGRCMAHYHRLCQIGITDLPTLIEALKEYCLYCSNTPKEDPIKKLERELIGCKIRGFFPTPKRVAERMLQLANIEPSMTVIEGSAGKGSIADLIKEYYPNCSLSVIEINYTLRDILKAKGYNLVGNDFLEHTQNYDRAIQNPPFESFQDIDHCYKAFSLLNAGGRLVSIVSESCFFREDKKAIEFRSWLEEVNAYTEKLPQGSFLESERSTGVATRIVVIDKPISTSTPRQVDTVIDVVNTVDISHGEKSMKVLSDQVEENLESIKSDEVDEVDKHFDAILSVEEYEAIKDNFLEHQKRYNSIMMKPSHHSWQDIEHIYHAYDLLNLGGALTSSVSETSLAKFASKSSSIFCKWLKSVGGTTHKLPDNNYVVIISKNTLF